MADGRGRGNLSLSLLPWRSEDFVAIMSSEMAGDERREDSLIVQKSVECRGIDAVISSIVADRPREMAKEFSVQLCKLNPVSFVLEEKTGSIKDVIGNGDSRSESICRSVICVPPLASSGTSAMIRSSQSSREITSNGKKSSMEDSNTNLETKTAVVEAPVLNGHRDREEENDVFSDALGTLSIAGSCSMNCSASGTSGEIGASESSLSLSRDAELREFILNRFLSAAQALVSESINSSLRKTRNPVRKQAIQLASSPRQPRNFARSLYRGRCRGDEDDCEQTSPNLIKGCGGIFPNLCAGNSFRFFNAIPVAKHSEKAATVGASRNTEPGEEDDSDDTFKLCSDGGHKYWEVTPRQRARRAKAKSSPVVETLASILSRPEGESEPDFAESEDAIADESKRILNPPALETRERSSSSSSSSAAAGNLGAILLPPTDSWLCRTLPSLHVKIEDRKIQG